MNLNVIKKSVQALTTSQLKRLEVWLHDLIKERTIETSKFSDAGRQVLEEQKTKHKTYRLESVRCGKQKCRCASGELHGPYWYAYWSEGGKTRSMYLGKKKPTREYRSSKANRRTRK
jgi:hypothetical protein